MILQRAHITACPNKRMAGTELRRLRAGANLGERELAERLGTYRVQIQRWEEKSWFELTPTVMQRLLDVLGASSL